ncbi:hypothetical protein BDV95DRAFT_589322 [Massariosphaeria phaeospora]|uniref:RING-type domain-containing protein n=1 Tax=Massariosphaeria phaeospora TaxID=100035 RepID=A0A7C8MW26_9PLEO|nr:hypothetical protein BDV95DRAFT_589322 [Massariosphaeria phaeospora]
MSQKMADELFKVFKRDPSSPVARHFPASFPFQISQISRYGLSCGDHVPVQVSNHPTCGHIFGEECIRTWVRSKNGQAHTCPICRAALFRPLETSSSENENGDPSYRPSPSTARSLHALHCELPRRSARIARSGQPDRIGHTFTIDVRGFVRSLWARTWHLVDGFISSRPGNKITTRRLEEVIQDLYPRDITNSALLDRLTLSARAMVRHHKRNGMFKNAADLEQYLNDVSVALSTADNFPSPVGKMSRKRRRSCIAPMDTGEKVMSCAQKIFHTFLVVLESDSLWHAERKRIHLDQDSWHHHCLVFSPYQLTSLSFPSS